MQPAVWARAGLAFVQQRGFERRADIRSRPSASQGQLPSEEAITVDHSAGVVPRSGPSHRGPAKRLLARRGSSEKAQRASSLNHSVKPVRLSVPWLTFYACSERNLIGCGPRGLDHKRARQIPDLDGGDNTIQRRAPTMARSWCISHRRPRPAVWSRVTLNSTCLV